MIAGRFQTTTATGYLNNKSSTYIGASKGNVPHSLIPLYEGKNQQQYQSTTSMRKILTKKDDNSIEYSDAPLLATTNDG
jgi:preprotein translocase subunit Sec63